MTTELEAGMRVRIPKGTRIVSDFHPQAPNVAYVRRAQIVTIDHCSVRDRRDGYRQTIRWAGKGGYWREVWADEVEVVA